MSPRWFFSRSGQTFGPFSWEQLQGLARDGRLLPSDLTAHEGGAQWLPAAAIAGLFSAPVAAAPLPPAPVAPPAPPARVAPPAAQQPQVVGVTPAHPRPAAAARTRPQPARGPEGRRVPGGGFVKALLALPKPILFGLFGAAGGLLGALLFGELLFRLFSPREVEPPPPQVHMAIPDSVRVYAGGKNRFRVKVARVGFDGAVTLRAEKAPAGFTVHPLELEPGKDEDDVEVEVAPGMEAKDYALKIRGYGPDGEEVKAGEGDIKVGVKARPTSVRLAVSPEVKLYQGNKGRLTLRIARENYDDPLEVAFSGVPERVKIHNADPTKGLVFDRGSSELLAEVVAQPDQDPVNVKVTATITPRKGAPPVKEDTAGFRLEVLKVPVPSADVIFVLDLTGSMQFAIDGVKRGIKSFVTLMKEKNIDARVGLVCFRDIVADNERPYIVLFNGEPFTTDYTKFEMEVDKLRAMGGGDDPESSLQALAKAAEQRFRPDAAKVILLITDAEPKIHPGEVPSTIEDTIGLLRKNPPTQLHFVVRTMHYDKDYKKFHDALRDQVKGSLFDIDAARSKGFASLLPTLSTTISKSLIAKAPEAPVGKGEPPPLPEASSTGDLPPQTAVPSLQAVQSTRRYRAEDSGQVVLVSGLWTLSVAGCIALLILAGQYFYTKQAWPGIPEGARALGGGILAGVVGGVVGQLWFFATPGGAVWNAVTRVSSWALLGGLMGLGMSFVIPNLKWTRGLLGGVIGGICGALGFLLIDLALGELLGRWIGALILGFFIGLMVALAEQLFRRWWLEIAFGAREVRTVTLGTAPVSIGGDERRASVYVAGAPAVALRYRLHGESVLCQDMQTGQTLEVQPGDQRSLGKVTVKVCSPASARQVGLALRLSNGRSLLLGVGMPLTGEDLPGLQPQAADGVVALVSARPSAPRSLLLRNRSRQTWTVVGRDGRPKTVEPGLGAELEAGLRVRFGHLTGVLEPADRARR
jgi:Mg-chelatase subunit ChlD